MGLLSALFHVGMSVAGAARQKTLEARCGQCGETTTHREGHHQTSEVAMAMKFAPAPYGFLHIVNELKAQTIGWFTYTCTRCGSHIELTREECSEWNIERIARNSSAEIGMGIAKDVVKDAINPFKGI